MWEQDCAKDSVLHICSSKPSEVDAFCLDLMVWVAGVGPIGIVALELGVRTYTGLDPAICLTRRAKTRDNKVGRTLTRTQCNAMKKSDQPQQPAREECN